MIFSGTDYRKLQEKEDYNFFINGIFDNVTGKAAIGFSGEGEKFDFNFLEGRVIDPSDNYVFSYDTGIIEISGNVNKNYYNYYINDEKVNFSGIKNNFKIDRFFIECSGCNIDIDNFIVHGSGATLFTVQNMESFIGDGSVITGNVVTNDSSFGRFDIFSGEVLTDTVTGLFSIETSLSTGIGATGLIGISGRGDIQNQNPYIFEANLYTSFGQVTQTFQVTGTTPFYQPDLTLNEASTLTSGGFPLVEKTGQYVAQYLLFTGSPFYASGLPISASLSYYTGYTGEITGALTGVTILESGQNYSPINIPPIIVTGDGVGAEVTGVVSPQGHLSDIKIINGGSGYTTAPTFLIYSGVSAVTVLGGGRGYFSDPVMEFEGGREGGRSAEASISSSLGDGQGTISVVGINDFGSMYTGVPSLNVIPGLSGVRLTASGAGYSATPTVFVENGGGSGAAVNALTGLGFITGFQLISGGSGYTGIPTISVSGGGFSIIGSGEAVLASGFSGTISMSSGAVGSGMIGDYTKSFTGQFNLLTGSGDSYYNFREAGQITSDNLSYTGEIIHFKANPTLQLGVESILDIRVNNLNFYDSLPLIAQLSVSGSGAYPPFVPSDVITLQVTGIK